MIRRSRILKLMTPPRWFRDLRGLPKCGRWNVGTVAWELHVTCWKIPKESGGGSNTYQISFLERSTGRVKKWSNSAKNMGVSMVVIFSGKTHGLLGTTILGNPQKEVVQTDHPKKERIVFLTIPSSEASCSFQGGYYFVLYFVYLCTFTSSRGMSFHFF